MISIERSDAPLAVLEGVFSVSRFDGGGADVLTIEMVPGWTVHLHAARITSWQETKRPRTLSIHYAGVEIRMASAPSASTPSWARMLERFAD